MSREVKNRDEFLKAFGAHLKQLREAHGISATELAFRCNSDKTSISRFENGRHAPGLDMLTLIAQAFDLTLSELFDGFEYQLELG